MHPMAYFRGPAPAVFNSDIIISTPAPPRVYTSMTSIETPTIEKPTIRKTFPETWIWDEVNMDG